MKEARCRAPPVTDRELLSLTTTLNRQSVSYKFLTLIKQTESYKFDTKPKVHNLQYLDIDSRIQMSMS